MSNPKSQSEFKSLINKTKKDPNQTECKRCCICCAKGGPALHKEDLELIKSGKLHGKFLFTIREGEPAEDNVKGGLTHAESDIIKIKSKENAPTCLFADITNSQCTIYEDRPLECRTLKCWDTEEIEELYNKERLSRKDIIGNIEGLWELVAEHQEKCSFTKIKQLIDETEGKIEGQAMKQLLEIVQYDISIRALVIEKTDTDPNLIPFLFGATLQSILKKLGVEFKLKSSN